MGDGVPTSSVPVRAVLVRQPALRRVEAMAGEAHTAAADDALEVHPEPATQARLSEKFNYITHIKSTTKCIIKCVIKCLIKCCWQPMTL